MADKRASNKESLKEVIERYLESKKMRDRLTSMDIEKQWPAIVGPPIAKHTTSLQLKKKVLIIRLDSSVIKEELSYGSDKLVKAVNNHFQREVIQEVLLS